jgi:hypothetical protein
MPNIAKSGALFGHRRYRFGYASEMSHTPRKPDPASVTGGRINHADGIVGGGFVW